MDDLKVFLTMLVICVFLCFFGAEAIQGDIENGCREKGSFNLWFGPTIECKIKE